MSTQVWLSNDDSDISGYKVAYIGTRSPNASSTVSTAITGTISTAAGSVAMTATSGGTAVKWITAPFSADVVVAGSVAGNFWGIESSASANAGIGLQLAEYTTSEQSAFMGVSVGYELTTSARQNQFTRFPAALGTQSDGSVFTSTTIEAGNRLVVLPIVVNIGTMGAGFAVTMDYNGATAGADGDTFIELTETILPNRVQLPASGASPSFAGGPSVVALTGLRRDLDPVVQEIASDDVTWRVLKNQLEEMEGVETA